MDKKSDLRTIRTQKYLRRALFELVGEKGLKDITVKELCERAEISRSTFYLYYDSIQDMVQSISDESRAAYNENARSILNKGMSFSESFTELIRHPFAGEDELAVFTELVKSGMVSWPMVFEVIFSVKQEFLRTFTAPSNEWTLDYVFHFITSGIVETVMKWTQDPSGAHSYSEVAELIIAILYNASELFSGITRR